MIDRLDLFKSFLTDRKIEYDADVDLSERSYFKSGSIVRLLVRLDAIESLKYCIEYLKEHEIPYKVIGATSNILFVDGVDHDVFLSLRKMNGFAVDEKNGTVIAGSGVMLPAFVNRLLDMGIKGFEGLEGIPGTVGGAVYMNAGAFRYEIQDNLLDVDILSPSGVVMRLDRMDLGFSFRYSSFQDNDLGVIVSARFRIEKGDNNQIKQKAAEFKAFRRKYLERKYPNLGSTFATYDIYKDIARQHRFYGVCIDLLRFFFYRLRRKHRPSDNRILNRFTAWYFGWDFRCQPYSDKTLNCIVNNGCTTDELLDYIKCIAKLTGGSISVENEIIGAKTFKVNE